MLPERNAAHASNLNFPQLSLFYLPLLLWMAELLHQQLQLNQSVVLHL
jgi:hypothetical protein